MTKFVQAAVLACSMIGALMFSSAANAKDAAEDAAVSAYSDVTIFHTGTTITMEPGYPKAKYIAVADGIILGLAQTIEELEPWTKGRTVTIDQRLAASVVMPGFIEPHIHPMQTVMMLPLPFISPEGWELPGKSYPAVTGKAEYEARLRKVLSQSDEELFITWGHHKLFHGDMDRALLDTIAPDRP